MNKPVLFDLCCKAGGCTKGYQEAGFYVVGVDLDAQPRYCGDAFIQMDALEVLRILIAGESVAGWRLADIAAFSASPPCQEYSPARHLRNATAIKMGRKPNIRPMLIDDFRKALSATGKPWIIENVEGSPLPSAIELCGSMFGLPIRRHRWFEASFLFFAPGPCRHTTGFYNVIAGKVRGYGDYASQTRTYVDAKGSTRRGEGYPGKTVGCKAFDIDWMIVDEMSEAIPPAYTHYVGEQLMSLLALTPTIPPGGEGVRSELCNLDTIRR